MNIVFLVSWACVFSEATAQWTRRPTRQPTSNLTANTTPTLASAPTWQRPSSNWTRYPTRAPTVQSTPAPTSASTPTATITSSNNTSDNITSTYDFSFYIDFKGPDDDVCSYNDVELVSTHLVAFIELLLNSYLTRNGLPGMVTDIRIYSLSDENSAGKNRERRLSFIWRLALGATCKGCAPDSSDQRRFLRYLLTEAMAKDRISAFMDDRLNGMITTSFSFRPNDAECKESAPEWTGEFIWAE